MNKVFLQGNLTRSPQLRYTREGTAVTDFGLAVDRHAKSRDGGPGEQTCFVEVLCLDELAEQMHRVLRKGMPAFVEGRLKQERWETSKGKRSKLKVIAQTVLILEAPSREAGQEAGPDDFELPDSGNPF